jgi:hypothetical protein
MEYYKIKIRIKENGKYKWRATIFYPFKKPILARTIGYLPQSTIDDLPTKKEIINHLKSRGKIHSL